jgi:phenylacetate-CoA ligase
MSIEDISFYPVKEIERVQQQKLRALIHYVSVHSKFYRNLFKDHLIDPASILTLEDFKRIPTTTKEDLQQYNWDFLCVEASAVAEYMSTSGTLGKPVTVALTASDLERLSINEAMSFAMAGCTANDIFQLMLTLDRQFMAGIAYYQGIQKLGATAIRVGPGLPFLQLDIIQRLKPSVLVAVPSFLIRLMEIAKEEGFDLNTSSVKRIICIGERIRNVDGSPNVIATTITKAWHVALQSTYASTEMQTAFTECPCCSGNHVNPVLLFVEVLDDHGNQVLEGELGEVTITTLGVEGMPLLRYRTGDIAKFDNTPCACGRHSTRISAIVGRKKQMLKWKGTTLFPQAIVDVIQLIPEIEDYAIEATTSALDTDDITVYISVKNSVYEIIHQLEAQFQSRIRVKPNIAILSYEEIQKKIAANSGRKIQRFIDLRGL